MVAGRPKVYDERRNAVYLQLKESLIEEIDLEARKSGISRTSYIDSILLNRNPKDSLKLAILFKELHEQTIKLKLNSEELNKKLSNGLSNFLYRDIDKDEVLDKWIEENKLDLINNYKKSGSTTPLEFAQYRINKFEEWLLKQGKEIKNQKRAITYLSKRLYDLGCKNKVI